MSLTFNSLDLPGIASSIWDVQVENGATPPEVVSAQRVMVDETRGPDGVRRRSFSCDARPGLARGRLIVRLIGIYASPVASLGDYGGPPTVGGEAYIDPGERTLEFTCLEDQEVSLQLDEISLMRPSNQGFFDIAVITQAPLGTRDAVWEIRVENNADPPQEVWSSRINAVEYGDARATVTYVGPCDPDPASNPNTVELSLLGLYPEPLPHHGAGRFADPVPEGGLALLPLPPISAKRLCLEDQDVLISWDVTPAVWARAEGSAGRALQFMGMDCRASLGCAQGEGNSTYTLRWACGNMLQPADSELEPAEPVLLLDDLVLTCEGAGGPTPLSPSDEAEGAFFSLSPKRQREEIGDHNATVWEVDLTLDDALLRRADCILSTRATAHNVANLSVPPYPCELEHRFPIGGVLPPAGICPSVGPYSSEDRDVFAPVYPYISWEIPLSAGGAVRCEGHALGDGSGAIEAQYSRADQREPIVFPYHYSPHSPRSRPSGDR